MIINKTILRNATALSAAEHLGSNTFSGDVFKPPYAVLSPLDAHLGYTIKRSAQTVTVIGMDQPNIESGIAHHRPHFNWLLDRVTYLFNSNHQLIWTSHVDDVTALIESSTNHMMAPYQIVDTWDEFLVNLATCICQSNKESEWSKRVFFVFGDTTLYWATSTLMDGLMQTIIKGKHFYATGHEEALIWYLVLESHPGVFKALDGCPMTTYGITAILKATAEKPR